jgi:1,4-dihydroxy-2-naphthoyl-CoA synthase
MLEADDRRSASVIIRSGAGKERLNAFSYDMYERLVEILRSLRFDTKTRVVVLTGAGRGFCSGNFSA